MRSNPFISRSTGAENISIVSTKTPQLDFGLAVSYLEGDERLSSQDTKLSEIQLWSDLAKINSLF